MLKNDIEELSVEVFSKRLRPKLNGEYFDKMQKKYYDIGKNLTLYSFITDALSVKDKFSDKHDSISTLDFTITQTLLNDDTVELAEKYIDDREEFNKIRDDAYRQVRDKNKDLLIDLYDEAMNASFPSPWSVPYERALAFTDKNLADSMDIIVAYTGTKLLVEDLKNTYHHGEGKVYNTHFIDIKKEDVYEMQDSISKSLYSQWYEYRHAKITKNILKNSSKKPVSLEPVNRFKLYEKAVESSKNMRSK